MKAKRERGRQRRGVAEAEAGRLSAEWEWNDGRAGCSKGGGAGKMAEESDESEESEGSEETGSGKDAEERGQAVTEGSKGDGLRRRRRGLGELAVGEKG